MLKKIKILFVLLVFCSALFAVKIAKAADWSISTLESDGATGLFNSLAVDSNDNIHISYYDSINEDLKYATNSSGQFVIVTLDTTGNVGQYGSIGIDSNNKVHISYYDSTNGDLKYATNASGLWVYTTIDSAENVGWFTSLAVDSNDKIHISYFDLTNSDLKYITNLSGSWTAEIIDSGGSFYSSLAIDSEGKVHIAYYGSANLKYASNIFGPWATTTLDSNGNVGVVPSLTIDSNNKFHISYYDSTNKDLKYITNASGSAVAAVIDSNDNIGASSSLALDSNNKVHIAYRDSNNNDLKYADNISGSWVSTVIDSIGNVGSYLALKLDHKNRIHVSYVDFTTDRDLKYAYTPGPSSGSVSVNSGDAYTVSRGVNLDLSVQGAPTEMIVSENADFTGAVWETYSTSKSFTLSSGEAAKTVYAKFRDQWYAESDVASDAVNYLTKPKFVTKNPKNLEVLVNKKNQEYEAGDLTFLFSKLPSKFLAKKYYIQMQKRAKYITKYKQNKKSTLKKYWRFETNFNKYQPKSSKKDFKLKIVFQYSDAEIAALKKIDKNIKEKNLALLRYNFSKKSWEKIMTKHNKKNNTFTLSGLKPGDFGDKFYYFTIGKK